jgi:hypothetical protein
MTDVIRLLTFQPKPEPPWGEPRRRQDRSSDEDIKPGAGSRHRRNRIE